MESLTSLVHKVRNPYFKRLLWQLSHSVLFGKLAFSHLLCILVAYLVGLLSTRVANLQGAAGHLSWWQSIHMEQTAALEGRHDGIIPH